MLKATTGAAAKKTPSMEDRARQLTKKEGPPPAASRSGRPTISWIAGDTDVHEFSRSSGVGTDNSFDADARQAFAAVFGGEAAESTAEFPFPVSTPVEKWGLAERPGLRG
jgi:hypothetical protein